MLENRDSSDQRALSKNVVNILLGVCNYFR